MGQQVNFYHEIYHPKFDPLAARSIVLLAGILLGVLGLVTAIMQWQQFKERTALKALQSGKETIAARVADLGTRHPVRNASEELTRTIADLEQEKSRKNSMLALLTEGKIGNSTGFALLFRELALARTEGAWLTGIGVFEGGQHLLIEGEGFQSASERIPALLQSITQRPLFKERTFGRLSIVPVKDRADHLHFQIKTDPERSLVRFWEQKEGDPEPAVLQKANQAIQAPRKEMKDGLKVPKPGKESKP